jgi:DNA-binding MarR family transcriptional regulator
MGSVAKLLAMDRTTLTANLKPLERRGLIRIAIDKEDRRGRHLSLTAKGKAVLGAAAPIWIETHFEIEKLLTAIGADDLRSGLRALT